jgi:hypothetical protein
MVTSLSHPLGCEAVVRRSLASRAGSSLAGIALSLVVGCGSAADGSATQGPAGEVGPWTSKADSPVPTTLQPTCIASAGVAYCLGARNTSVYTSQLSPAGLGPWEATTAYPEPIEGPACVTAFDRIVCVGGVASTPDGGVGGLTNAVYDAPLTASGVGAWVSTTPLPSDLNVLECMTGSNAIYCIVTDPDSGARGARFAPISSAGIGAWSTTTPPPANSQGCVGIGDYAYCFGGSDCASFEQVGYCPSSFAPLSAGGIGTWETTTALPSSVSAQIAVAGSYIYYLSVPVLFAPVSASGIGAWQTTTNLPEVFDNPGATLPNTCFASNGYLYCGNPAVGSTFFAQLGVPNPQALQLQNPPPYAQAEYLAPDGENGGAATVNGTGAPVFSDDIDQAAILDCKSSAATAGGCTTTVKGTDAMLDYTLTVWYPCNGPTPSDANCCYQAAVPDVATVRNAWCISVGGNSFLVANEIIPEVTF